MLYHFHVISTVLFVMNLSLSFDEKPWFGSVVKLLLIFDLPHVPGNCFSYHQRQVCLFNDCVGWHIFFLYIKLIYRINSHLLNQFLTVDCVMMRNSMWLNNLTDTNWNNLTPHDQACHQVVAFLMYYTDICLKACLLRSIWSLNHPLHRWSLWMDK